MRVLVSGASGLIGSGLVRSLRADGVNVQRLVRRAVQQADEVGWDPQAGRGPDPKVVDGVDAVVHLSGAGLGDRFWTTSYKREIRASRVETTRILAETLAGLAAPPRVFLVASAIGWYGDTGDRETDENGPPGSDFLANVCREWEEAAAPARLAGIRTVHVRSGIVLSTRGGALARVLPLFRLGLGARLGTGRQWVSWIARPDHVAALRFLLDSDLSGPVNLTAPQPVTNAEYTAAIARAVRRPAFLSVPAPALRLLLGEMAQLLLVSQRVIPRRLLDAGFTFGYPDVDSAVRELVASGS